MNEGLWDLRSWLLEHREEIARRWRAGIREREDRRGEDSDGILGSFIQSLVLLLPASLGEGRDLGESVWHQATHLYGSLALQRGLAAGEVVEELQLLRPVIIKLLLAEPPRDWAGRSLKRDLLALNKLVDAGVVRASVAYVDDLFFAHLQGSGVPGGLDEEVEQEIGRQLEAFRREIGDLG